MDAHRPYSRLPVITFLLLLASLSILIMVIRKEVRTAQAIAILSGKIEPANMAMELKGRRLASVTDVHGRRREISQFAGLTLVIVFHPQCGYCEASHPGWRAIAERYAPLSIMALTASADPSSATYLDDIANDIPVIQMSISGIDKAIGTSATPVTLLIDSEHTIIKAHVGAFRPGTWPTSAN